ncbi:MAG: hypothetical protein ACYDEN_12560 [Acidimicrobiales bacterium]
MDLSVGLPVDEHIVGTAVVGTAVGTAVVDTAVADTAVVGQCRMFRSTDRRGVGAR